MDETKETKQGTSLETGSSSGGEVGTTSAKPPKETYTRDEHLKEISDLKAEQGRKFTELTRQLGDTKTQLDTKDTELKTANQKLDGLEDRLDELERQGLGDSPEAEKLLRERQEIRKAQRKLQEEQANLERDKLQHAEDIRVVRESKWDITVWEIASKHNVDPMVLKELGLSSAEQVEKAAKIFADAKVASGQGTETPLGEGATSGLKTDSAKGKGGKELPASSIDKMKLGFAEDNK